MGNTDERIKKIGWVYKQYDQKLKQVERFVKVTISQKSFIEVAETKVKGADSTIDEYLENIKGLSNSVVLYNAVIISIYGSFELYVDELLKAYIEYLKTRQLSFKDFPKKLQQKQKDKAAEFLGNPGRFLNYGLNDEQVILNLMGTFINDSSSEVTEKLLIAHGGNLRTGPLCELFNEFGFENLSAKLKKHKKLKEFSKDNGLDGEIIIPKTFPLLDEIVEERNKVAHGWTVDSRISFSLLLQNYIPFFRVFCEALNDVIVSQIIQDSIDSNELLPFDPIIKVWEKGTIIGINNKEFKLHIGDILYYTTPEDWNYKLKIQSLTNEKINRSYIRAKNKDITIGCNSKIKENYKIWGIKNLSK